jgi:16S rRNA (cytosine967-C5)-methyltransferase
VNGQNPRLLAAQVLQTRREGEYVQQLLDKALAGSRMSAADRHLCQELVYGVTRWEATLDFLIERKAPGRTQKPGLQVALRLGLYQLFWLDRVPAHAAVFETVNLARETGFGPQSGFVNAVLRSYVRETDVTRTLLNDLKEGQPHLGYSHPAWLVERWSRRYGRENTVRLLQWNNTPPLTFARLNSLKTNAEKLLPQWREEDVDYDFVHRDWIPENLVFRLKSHPPLATLPSFGQGLFYIQDPSTLLAVHELAPEPGERILDLCAAPGGKLTYIAQLTQNQGLLVAHDTSAERLEMVRENCTRLGVTSVEFAEPSTALDKVAGGRFDRILIDAPCSNTGVMRRRVDLRWRIREQEIPRLANEQRLLLRNAAALLKPGGTLIYSTCSLEPEENQQIVSEFVQQFPKFEMQTEQQLIPFQEEVDGAYVARLVMR